MNDECWSVAVSRIKHFGCHTLRSLSRLVAINIFDRMKRFVANRGADVFMRTDFETFGSQAQVGRALTKLQSNGALVKLGLGVYAKAKPSIVSGKPISVKPLGVLNPEVLKKLGVQVNESRQTREYNSRSSTQVPPGIVYGVGKRRIQRKLGFNGKFVQYERE